jgi:hypothetical protein
MIVADTIHVPVLSLFIATHQTCVNSVDASAHSGTSFDVYNTCDKCMKVKIVYTDFNGHTSYKEFGVLARQSRTLSIEGYQRAEPIDESPCKAS